MALKEISREDLINTTVLQHFVKLLFSFLSIKLNLRPFSPSMDIFHYFNICKSQTSLVPNILLPLSSNMLEQLILKRYCLSLTHGTYIPERQLGFSSYNSSALLDA